MKAVYALLILAICITGCTARQGFVTTCGFVAAAGASMVGMDYMETSKLVEDSVDLAIEGGVAVKDAHAAKKARDLTRDND